ncbi:MAG: hypothetical protein QE271_07110 [Bacteriovoracaceae bacterium]|nr:hypothetical protein [Bacteriovoracaceae bacterium]
MISKSWMLEKTFKHPIMFLFILYFLSYSSILINNGYFFDDWHLYHLSSDFIWSYFNSVGRTIMGLELIFLKWAGLPRFIVNSLIFSAFWLTGQYFYLILKNLNIFSPEKTICIAALFICYPQYFSRICMSVFPFTFGLTVFTITTYFYLFWPKDKQYYLRYLLIITYFLSFSLESLLIFYAIPIALKFYLENNFKITFKLKSLQSFVKKNCLFLLIPFIYYYVFKIRAEVADNALMDFKKLNSEFFPMMYSSFKIGFIDCIHRPIRSLLYPFLGIAAIASAFYPLLNYKRSALCLIGTIVAIAFFFFSILPYIMVGKPILYYYIGDRTAILSLFSGVFIIYFTISFALSFTKIKSLKPIFFSFILLCFVARNFYVFHTALVVSIKQDAVVDYMKSSPEFKMAHTFYFIDNTQGYLLLETPFDASVANGLIGTVFPEHNKCISNFEDECLKIPNSEIVSPLYNLTNYIPAKNDYKILIDHGSINIRGFNLYKMIYYKFFDLVKYQSSLKKILSMTFFKLTS